MRVQESMQAVAVLPSPARSRGKCVERVGRRRGWGSHGSAEGGRGRVGCGELWAAAVASSGVRVEHACGLGMVTGGQEGPRRRYTGTMFRVGGAAAVTG